MLKRLMCFVLILSLLGLSGCQPRENEILDYPAADNEAEPDMQETTDDETEQETSIYVEEDRFGTKLCYQFDNEDAKTLAKFINGLTFDGDMCKCMGPYALTLGEKSYNVAVAEGSDDCYVRINGKQKNLTAEERDQILAIFKRQLTAENRLPGGEENIFVGVRTADGYYSTYGADGLLLGDLIDSLEFDESTDAYSAPLRIDMMDVRVWGDLSAEEPYLFNFDGKIAKVGDRLEDLKAILDRICRDENRKESAEGEVYVVAYGDPNLQYRFKNEDSAKILRWIGNLRFSNGKKENSCTCKATYRIYNGDYLYLSLQSDGSAHFYDKPRERHIVISKEDAQQLIEWFTPHCVKENEVPYYA